MEEADAMKRKRRLSLDQRIERQSQLLDEWLSTLTLAATREAFACAKRKPNEDRSEVMSDVRMTKSEQQEFMRYGLRQKFVELQTDLKRVSALLRRAEGRTKAKEEVEVAPIVVSEKRRPHWSDDPLRRTAAIKRKSHRRRLKAKENGSPVHPAFAGKAKR
jgi:hypothetical protein